LINYRYVFLRGQILDFGLKYSLKSQTRLFLIQKIGIEQSLSGVITVVVNYLYLPGFFENKKDNKPFSSRTVLENALLQGISVLVGAKIIVISCFNLKKIYSNRYKKVNNIINFSNFKNSSFCHVISIYVLTILIYSKHSAKLLVDYIKLELKSTRKHNTFILFLKNLLSFLLLFFL
jgi:hypothetical protein